MKLKILCFGSVVKYVKQVTCGNLVNFESQVYRLTEFSTSDKAKYIG